MDTGLQIESGQFAALYAVRQTVNVPVELYWCSTGKRDVVINVSPSPKSHLKRTASGDEVFVNVCGVFSTGTGGGKKYSKPVIDSMVGMAGSRARSSLWMCMLTRWTLSFLTALKQLKKGT